MARPRSTASSTSGSTVQLWLPSSRAEVEALLASGLEREQHLLAGPQLPVPGHPTMLKSAQQPPGGQRAVDEQAVDDDNGGCPARTADAR